MLSIRDRAEAKRSKTKKRRIFNHLHGGAVAVAATGPKEPSFIGAIFSKPPFVIILFRHPQTYVDEIFRPLSGCFGLFSDSFSSFHSSFFSNTSTGRRGGRSGVRVYKAGRSPDETKRDEMKRSENERTKRKE